MKDGGSVPIDQLAEPPASLYWRLGVPMGLVLLILTAFVPALDAGFVGWDDTDLLLGNTRYQELSAKNLRWIFTTSYGGHFQPLTWLSYSLDWALWNREAFGFHLTNVLLHVLTTLAFYALSRRLLVLSSRRATDLRSRSIILGAGMAAALFAIHPLRAESVAWLAERRDVLSGVLYVLAVSFYVRYAAPSSRAAGFSPRGAWYFLAVACCALSLLAKASAITIPFVLLVLDVYPLRRFGFATGSSTHSVRRVLIEKLPFVFMALLAGIRALIAQQDGGALYTLASHDIPARLAQMCYGLVFYVRKTVWPADLGPLYQIPPRDVLLGSMLWINVAIILTVTMVAVRMRRCCPAAIAALVAYVVIVLPVLGLAQSGPQLAADRYSYLSCMGFALLAGGLVIRLSQAARPSGYGRPLLVLASSALLVFFARATFQQSNIWTSGVTLWARGVHVSPDSAVAHTNYGDALARATLFPAAMKHLNRALELDPRDAVAHHHLGDIATLRGDPNAAIYHYAHSLSIDPTRRSACFSLGRALVDVGQHVRAVAVLRDGAFRNPNALDLIDYLARLLSTHPDEAIRSADEAVSLALHVTKARPSYVPALLTLATAYANAGRFDDAIAAGEEGLHAGDHTTDERTIEELKRRIELFRSGEPYRTKW